MTTWNCAAINPPGGDVELTMVECGVPRAVGALDCPECGTTRAPFRENGAGAVYEFVDVTALDREPGTEWVTRPRVSGTEVATEVPEREESDNAEDQW